MQSSGNGIEVSRTRIAMGPYQLLEFMEKIILPQFKFTTSSLQCNFFRIMVLCTKSLLD